MAIFGKKKQNKTSKFPGIRQLLNGNSAVIMCEKESSDAASTTFSASGFDMGTEWNLEKNKGHLNISNRPLISISADDNQSSASITAGLSLSGLRATHFSSSSQNIASMHESLYVAVGKRLPYILNIACKSTTKASATFHCGHDDYHSMDDTGFIQFFARDNQAAADLNIISRKIAELSLNPAVVAQDGFLTSQLIEPLSLPERELIESFLGLASDIINTPTPAQQILYGETRRRIPETFTVDQPVQSGSIQNADSYMQTVAGQRPFFFDHVSEITDQCMDEWYELTGRRYHRINQYNCDAADYLIIAQGSIINTAEVISDYLSISQKLKIGIVNMTLFRPFPGDLISHLLKGKKGVVVLERTDQPLSEDLPIISDIRSAISKAIDNGNSSDSAFQHYAQYSKATDAPPLYSVCFGLGGHQPQDGDIIAAVENMLAEGKQQKFSYLGIKFVDEALLSPQQEIQQQSIIDAYPNISSLSLRRAKNPELLSNTAISLRIHALGGHKSSHAGKDIAQTLFDKFNLYVKAIPAQGIEKKSQPSTFYLTAAPEPIRIINAYHSVNTVIATDANIFSYCNPLDGLIEGGVFIIQSAFSAGKDVWQSFPNDVQKTINDNNIKVFFIDANKIALETSQDLVLQLDLQSIIFKALLFKCSHISFSIEKTVEETQALIDNNIDLVKRSYNEVTELNLAELTVGDSKITPSIDASAPLLLQQKPANKHAIADIHRFWNQTAFLYNDKKPYELLADPFSALGIVPASTGIFSNISSSRSHHLKWIPEKCNGCGNCYKTDTDNAIYALVNTVNEVFESNIKRIEKQGHQVKHLRRAIRVVEKKYHALTADKSTGTDLTPIFAKAIGDTIKEYAEHERDEVEQEFEWFKQAQGSFKFALTKPYHDEMNSRMPRSGGLFSLTINPDSHKGGRDCISNCESLVLIEQTPESLKELQDNWDYWQDLPTSNKKYSRISDLQNKQGVLHSLLLDKKNHHSLFSSGNTSSDSSEPIALHLFTSTITALMQPRIEQHIKHINTLINDMEKHIRLKLVETLDISDIDALETAIDENQNIDLTLSRLSGALDKDKATQPIDPTWLKWALQIVAKLKHLKWNYQQGQSGNGRSNLAMTQGNDIASGWTANYPYNPYPFPWASHLSVDAPSLAMGLFEGHMLKMAEGFKTIRTAELEIKGKYDKTEHDPFFTFFDWHQFDEQEYLLCPPLVTLSAEGISTDSGFQSLSHSLVSGVPIKVLVLDNQPSAAPEKAEKELMLLAMAHRTSYVQQGSIANTQHLLESFIDGLNYKGPALWSIYASSQPQSYASLSLVQQSKLAIDSRTYPLTTFNPTAGKTWEECINLAGNPELDQDWITYSLDYTDEYGNNFSMDVPLTYADWALTEAKYSQHFKALAAESDSEEMVLLTDYLEMDNQERSDNIPFIWAVHAQSNHLLKVIVSSDIVSATEQKRNYWHTLKSLAGNNKIEVDTQAIADHAKAEMAQTITEGLMSMIGGDASALTRILAAAPSSTGSPVPTEAAKKPIPTVEQADTPKPAVIEKDKKEDSTAEIKAEAHEPVWIETPDCTTCDECVEIAPAMFKYNADKKAIVVNPTAGTFEEIVRSAEKCTAVIIHPGTPWNLDEPNLEKLIKRAEKFQ